MKIGNNLKLPLFLVSGIGIGLLISNLFIFSDTIKQASKEQKTLPRDVRPYTVFQPYIPDTLTFCGEVVPLENFDVYEALDFELIANTYRHSSTIIYIKRANRYFPQIERLLKQFNIPDDMKYLCVAESGLANVVSPSGAAGFWQFMKATAIERNMVVDKNIDERNNDKKSLIAATEYLHEAYSAFGNWTLAAASYNMGMGGLKRDMDFQRVDTYWDLALNQETARYIYRILALKLIMSNPELYGFDLQEEDMYDEIETYEVSVDSSITNLVQFAFDRGTNYKMLKYFNPWIIGNSLPNPSKKQYFLTIPKAGARHCDIPEKK